MALPRLSLVPTSVRRLWTDRRTSVTTLVIRSRSARSCAASPGVADCAASPSTR